MNDATRCNQLAGDAEGQSTEPRITGRDPVIDSLAEDGLLLEQQLCFPLYAASNMVVRAYRPLLKPLGLTYPQYLVMLVLWQHGEHSVTELGHSLKLDSGTLTPLLKRMENNGLVLRQRCRSDERKVMVNLTAAGQELRRAASDIPNAMACKMAGDQQWLGQLRDDLNQLLGQMESKRQLPPDPEAG